MDFVLYCIVSQPKSIKVYDKLLTFYMI